MEHPTYTEEYIKTKLATDEKWVRRALIRLLQRQTLDEQRAETTRNHNAMGFQPCDARWFTRIAQYATKYPTKQLSIKQLAIVRREWRGAPAICKYAKQLMTVMQEDAAKKALAAQVDVTVKMVSMEVPEANICQRCGEQKPFCRCEMKDDYAAMEREQEMLGAMSSMR